MHKLNREEKVIILTSTSHFLDHMFILILAAVLPLIMNEYKIGYTEVGLAGNVCYFLFGLGALPAGFLADRLGSYKLIVIFLFAASLSSIAVGMSGGFISLIVTLAVLGIVCALYHPSGYSFISNEIRIEKRGRGFGIHGVAGNIGLALTPVMAGAIASAFGWRGSYIILALPAAAAGVMSLTWLKSASGGSNPTTPDRSRAEGNAPTGGGTKYLTLPAILILLISFLNGVAYRGVATFLPSFLAFKMGLSTAEGKNVFIGGALATSVLLIGAMGQYLGGSFADRFKAEWIYAIFFFLSAPFAIIMALLWGQAVIFTAVFFSFFYMAGVPVGNYLLAKYVPGKKAGSAFGLYFFISFGAGSIGSGLGGVIADELGLQYVFHASGLLILASAVIASFFIKIGKTYMVAQDKG